MVRDPVLPFVYRKVINITGSIYFPGIIPVFFYVLRKIVINRIELQTIALAPIYRLLQPVSDPAGPQDYLAALFPTPDKMFDQFPVWRADSRSSAFA